MLNQPKHDITAKRTEVQQLANRIHQAKVALDQTLWGPGGMPTDPEALGRYLSNLRRASGPGSVPRGIEQAHLLDLAYRKVRAEYLLAKAELNALTTHAGIPDRVEATREKLKQRFAGPVQHAAVTTGEFNLANDPALVKAISETLTEAVQQMKRERTAAGIAAVLETVGTAESMGFHDLRSGEVKAAMNAARELSRDLLDKAENSGVSSPILERNKMQLRVILQQLDE